jgi:hypothetical protein
MTLAAVLSADRLSGSASLPHIQVPERVNTDAFRTSAEIRDLTLAQLQRGLPTAMLPFNDAAANIIEILFPDTSRHGTAIQAAQSLGASDDKITRILARETKRIDAQLLFRCLALYQHRFKKPFPLGGGFGLAFVEVPA